MSVHDKMTQDQIWVRPNSNADALTESRTHGQHYLYLASPNTKERIEMSYRSLGRQFDWDMEKFRNGPKAADKGNKRRFMKNVARFVKNPVGYVYWKTFRVNQRLPLFLTLISAGFVANMFFHRRLANNQARVEKALHYEGSETFSSDYVDNSRRPGKLGIPNTAIFRAIYSYPTASEFVINPVYEQNYRKYFDAMNYTGQAVKI